MTDPVRQDEAKQALSKAKLQFMTKKDTTFFVTVLFSLKHVLDERIPTACTDGRTIRYNPDYLLKLTEPERLGLMLHEVFHVIFLHMTRLNGRDPALWNVATDLCINLLITDRGFTLPKGGLLDEQYRDMTSEEIYARLPQSEAENAETHFELGDGEDGAPIDAETLERDLQDVLVRAQIQSQMAGDKPGTIPGEIELYIERLLKPKLPTATLLRKFLNDCSKDDYSWRRPNRRFFPRHYLPSLHTDSLEHIAVFIDASGSVSDEEFQRFVSEVGGILKQMRPKKLTLIAFDTQIQTVHEVSDMRDLVRIKFTGRGGTDIDPVMAWCQEHNPRVALVFTDGYFRMPPGSAFPKNPLIWLIHNNTTFQAPKGRVVRYHLKD